MLDGHTLFLIADTHAVSLLYEMQLLYVSAKVEIISELNKYLQKKDAPHIFMGASILFCNKILLFRLCFYVVEVALNCVFHQANN